MSLRKNISSIEICKNIKLMKGLNVYFYDLDSASKEFKDCGLIDIQEIDEPIKHIENQHPLIECKKS